MAEDRHNTVLNLFVEIAMVEHLLRNRLEQLIAEDLTAGQFGIVSHFVRTGKTEERLSILAWSFQDSEAYTAEKIAVLQDKGYVEAEAIPGSNDQNVRLTDAGRQAHERSLQQLRPEVAPLLEEIDSDELVRTLNVIREMRRTLDNLPGR
jgi:DNA-binding MarR family transcriptional regulator